MSSISSEAKVGLFVLIGFIILGYMTFQVGQRGLSFKKDYQVEVVFDNAAGLTADASVQIAGVEIGRVASIRRPWWHHSGCFSLHGKASENDDRRSARRCGKQSRQDLLPPG